MTITKFENELEAVIVKPLDPLNFVDIIFVRDGFKLNINYSYQDPNRINTVIGHINSAIEFCTEFENRKYEFIGYHTVSK